MANRSVCRRCEATVGSLSMVRIAVSSAKVAVRGRISLDPALCLVVLLRLWVSDPSIHLQPSPESVGFEDMI
jgi:hypothetical protein